MTHVYILDAWDDYDGKATCTPYSSKEDAVRAKERFLSRNDVDMKRIGVEYRFAEVVRRKVR